MMMRGNQKRRKKAEGWKVGTADEFLGLSPEESAILDMKLRLGQTLQNRRTAHHLTQAQLARRIKSSQSRVAKMEGGDPSVSLDLLVRSLLTLGASNKDLAETLAGAQL